MQILQDVDLRDHSTMRLGGKASFACEVSSQADLLAALQWAEQKSLAVRVIGSGSNIIWRDSGFDGLLICNRIKRYERNDFDDETVYITVGGGEDWDTFVAQTVEAGLTGIEAMSLIPGSCGATPVQNVGAYGQDIAQSLMTLEAYDTKAKTFIILAAADCGFGYRTSRFKTTDSGRFIITALTFRLLTTAPLPPFYPAVTDYLAVNSLEPSAASIRQAVIAIRTSKLPDPAVVGNTGSFFANPIISAVQSFQLLAEYPDMPHWDTPEGVKLSGAWLIEQAGFKDYHDTASGMATWGNQPLVLVNEHATTTENLLQFKKLIVDGVQAKFEVTLEQEPELLP